MQKVDKEDFLITVMFKKRLYQYKVVYQCKNNDSEQFTIITRHRTVVVEANRQVLQRRDFRVSQRNYTYDTAAITNKSLMKKIIVAINKQLGTKTSWTTPANAVAI